MSHRGLSGPLPVPGVCDLYLLCVPLRIVDNTPVDGTSVRVEQGGSPGTVPGCPSRRTRESSVLTEPPPPQISPTNGTDGIPRLRAVDQGRSRLAAVLGLDVGSQCEDGGSVCHRFSSLDEGSHRLSRACLPVRVVPPVALPPRTRPCASVRPLHSARPPARLSTCAEETGNKSADAGTGAGWGGSSRSGVRRGRGSGSLGEAHRAPSQSPSLFPSSHSVLLRTAWSLGFWRGHPEGAVQSVPPP